MKYSTKNKWGLRIMLILIPLLTANAVYWYPAQKAIEISFGIFMEAIVLFVYLDILDTYKNGSNG